jgi:hypothetical protein
MKTDHYTATITIRSIENGVIAQSTAGPAFGKHSRTGEIYFPTLEAVSEWAAAQIVHVERTANELRDDH